VKDGLCFLSDLHLPQRDVMSNNVLRCKQNTQAQRQQQVNFCILNLMADKVNANL
jgi:hypothetical protein